jgi:polyphosphate kinase
MIERRFDVVTAEQLAALARQPFASAKVSDAAAVLYRDLFLDTGDDHLQRRGITCRLRVGSDDRRVLTAFVGTLNGPTPPRRYEATVDSAIPREALAGETEPARRLAAVVDVRLLETKLELQVERLERTADRDWIGRSRLSLFYDRVHVRSGMISRAFHQLTVRTTRTRGPVFERVCAELEEKAGLRPIAAGTRERAQLLLKWLEREERGRPALSDAGVVLILTRGRQLALFAHGGLLTLPYERGSGVGCARTLLDRCTRSGAFDARLIGKVSSIGPQPAVEVWTAELADDTELPRDLGDVIWANPTGTLDRAPTLHPDALAALSVAIRAGLLAEPARSGTGAVNVPAAQRSMQLSVAAGLDGEQATGEGAPDTGEPHTLNSETSILAFSARVLALAEDLRTPLAERLRFLSIVADGLDEFFMVRVAGIKRSALEQAEERLPDGLTPRQQLDLISLHARSLVARHYRCYHACAAEAEAHGGRIVTWNDLDAKQRDELREVMHDELLASLTPLAMTLSPGHPFPRVRHLSLSLAVVFVDRPGSTPHFAQIELPDDTPRLIPVPDLTAVITAEELIRANLDLLYPSSVVEQAYAFRVTRGADLEIDEDQAQSLIKTIEEASKRRHDQPVVRVEVERAMPALLRDVVMRELRREDGGVGLDIEDIYEVDGPLDLRCLRELPLTDSDALSYASFQPVDPLPHDRSIWSAIDEGDRLCHHPFDDFDASVGRFFTEAAEDPGVTAIKMTVYRCDERSPVVAALIDAAAAGKDVVVFVELKARFDEERNVGWAKRLEAAGGRVVHGLVGFKTHAKVALVVRRDGSHLRRYVHAGTGNYNAETARRYTDLSLFTSNESITADVQDLFNELTGRSHAPQGLTRGCLISPKQLLPELIARIEREAAHARSGRSGHVRMKVNGLSDPDVVNALVRAARDGVRVELIVRGVCTLRPGVAGLTENVTIVSVLGRFLEHSRIFYVGNAGAPEYFIGSADMRPRNLRRRVELLVPVNAAVCRAELDMLFEMYLADVGAWELTAAGEYVRRGAGANGAQDSLLDELTATLT